MTCFRKLSQVDIDRVREHLYSLETETAQNQLVLDYFAQHSSDGSAVMYTVAGKMVCETCWRLVYGLRYNKFSSLKQKFATGVIHVEHGRQGLSQPRYVYGLACDDLTQGNMQCCSISTFYDVWSREFPHVQGGQGRVSGAVLSTR